MAAAAAAVLRRARLVVLVLVLVLAMVGAAEGAEMTTHIKVYWHDVVSGTNPTAVQVAQAPTTNSSASFFGVVMVIDDPLTEGPDMKNSAPVGRAQGTYISAGKDKECRSVINSLEGHTYVLSELLNFFGSAY
uniref:Dirigent protein n=1 Tax=Oryza brachyantha TaxID=4533 RepID=J3NBT0_ORYBR